jgi:hypothetical protein
MKELLVKLYVDTIKKRNRYGVVFDSSGMDIKPLYLCFLKKNQSGFVGLYAFHCLFAWTAIHDMVLVAI